MVNFIFVLLVIGLIMFIVGIVLAILTVMFVKRKEHPILSILFAVILCPCIYIPIKLIIGTMISRILLIITLIFSITMVIFSVKIIITVKSRE